MKIIIAWNTGCKYTSAGQRIAAGLDDDGYVYFYDIDRVICGKIASPWLGSSLGLSAEWVHRNYLQNDYESVSISDLRIKALAYCADQVGAHDDV